MLQKTNDTRVLLRDSERFSCVEVASKLLDCGHTKVDDTSIVLSVFKILWLIEVLF